MRRSPPRATSSPHACNHCRGREEGAGGVTWRILGLTACPAGEINYYLLRSLGLNGGNDVHHAQTEGSTETDGGQPVVRCHGLPALNRKRRSNICGRTTFVAALPLPFLLSLSLFNGNRFTLCGLRIVLENITHKQERNPPDGHAGYAVRGKREGRGCVYRKFRGHYYLAGRVKNIYALPNFCPRPS